jgi:hypothetical protein
VTADELWTIFKEYGAVSIPSPTLDDCGKDYLDLDLSFVDTDVLPFVRVLFCQHSLFQCSDSHVRQAQVEQHGDQWPHFAN